MEHKYMNNPKIINFLSQYDRNEWDSIIEDLLIYSINKIKEIEKAEEPKNKIEIPKKPIYGNSEFISFKNFNSGPYECATNFLIQNAEMKSNSGLRKSTLKKLDEINKKINDIHSTEKNKSLKKKKK